MQRLLRIVLFITFMLLIILWFSTIFNTCNKDEASATQTEDMAEGQDTADVFQDLDDALFEDENLFTDETGNADSGTSGQSMSEQTTDPFEETIPADDYTDYTGTPETSTSTSTSTYNEDATYLVVAGSFLVRENADRMQRKLSGMGYAAEVRNFNYSQYHSVIAGRYNDMSSANAAVSVLKANGISSYVHKRQP